MSIQSTQDNGNSGVPPVVDDSSNIDNKSYAIDTRSSNDTVEHSESIDISPITDGGAKKDVTQGDKALRPLTGKERAYIKFRVDNPTATKPEAIKAIYDVKEGVKNKTLRNMASTIEKRPSVLAILSKHAEEAEETLADVMKTSRIFAGTGTKEGATYAGVAEKTANSILDRLHGKARQTVDITSTSVNLNIDLNSIDSTS